MTKRTYGQGSVYRRSVDGRWYGTLDIGAGTGRRRRVTVSGASHEAVEIRLARLHRRRRSAADEMTLADWLCRWRDELLPGTVAAESTVDNYAWAIDHHLVPGLGKTLLIDLSPADVAVFLHRKLEAGLAVRTVARLRTVLGTALGHAVLLGHLQRNVALLVRPPRGTIDRGRSLTLAQGRELLRAASGHRFEAAFTIMLLVGLRPGEVLGLRWSDIDIDEGVLSVNQSLKRGSHGMYFGPPKTRQSHRRVALPAQVITALRRRREAQAKERAQAAERWEEDDLVFTTRHGKPVEHPRLGKELARLTNDLGLGRWHPHELRHSAVSLLSAAGVRLEDVADVMGHRSTRTTSAVYRHVVVPTIDAGQRPAERLFA
jgi:integrase